MCPFLSDPIVFVLSIAQPAPFGKRKVVVFLFTHSLLHDRYAVFPAEMVMVEASLYCVSVLASKEIER